MSKLKLTYFDFHGGRGEPARLALSIGEIPFEDDRVPPAEWEGRKAQTPFGALPVLERDGQVVAQSNAINRYVGKLADLYPSDPWQAALCDEVMGALEDIGTKIGATLFLTEEQKKLGGKSWSQARSHFISPGSGNGSKHTEAGTLPTIASPSPTSKSSCGSGTLNQGPSTMCRLTCPIASRPSWLSTMNG